jgi:anti-anti-sigma factor
LYSFTADEKSASRLIVTHPRRGITLLTLTGKVDPVNGLQLRKDLLAAMHTPDPTIVVDVTGVESLGSLGLHVLQEALAWVEPWHRLRVVTGNRKSEFIARRGGLAAGVETFELLEAALADATPAAADRGRNSES